MNQWIKANVVFSRREKIFTISGRGGSSHKRIVEALRELHISPIALEDVFRQLIEEARPELTGCTLWFMDFEPARLCWIVGVQHGNLPPVGDGGELQRESLFHETDETGGIKHGPL